MTRDEGLEPPPAMAIDPETFDAAVEQAFAPAMRRLGFELTQRQRYGVRFDRGPALVEIHYDAARSWELDVWLGRTDREPSPIALDHALEATSCDGHVAAGLQARQTGDPRFLRTLLARAADALGGCGAELLAEDGEALERAFERREEEAAMYESRDVPPHVLEEADAAWAAKDFARLKDVLEPVRDRLDPRHTRRLAFAEKRLFLE